MHLNRSISTSAHSEGSNAGGPQTRWNEEDVRDDLRAEFIKEIEISAPEVLMALRDELWPSYREVVAFGGREVGPFCRWPEDFRARARKIAREYHLVYLDCVPGWVLEQFAYTLWFWTRHPELAREEKLRWWARGGCSGMRKVDDLSIDLPRVERSIYESDVDFKKRVYSSLEPILRLQFEELSSRIAELPVSPRKRRPEHYTWVVLHQIRRWSFENIADHFHVSPFSVRNEVTELKRQIGLRLPAGPKSHPSFRPNTQLQKGVFAASVLAHNGLEAMRFAEISDLVEERKKR